MTLTCKPKGRGNWATLVIVVTGRRAPSADLFDFRIGSVFQLGALTLRIVGIGS